MNRPMHPREFKPEELEFYKGEYRKARERDDVLGCAQVMANIADLTGWPMHLIASRCGISAPTLSTYRKIMKLEPTIQNMIAGKRLSNVGAIVVAELEAHADQVAFVRYMEGTGCSLLRGTDFVGHLRKWRAAVAEVAAVGSRGDAEAQSGANGTPEENGSEGFFNGDDADKVLPSIREMRGIFREESPIVFAPGAEKLRAGLTLIGQGLAAVRELSACELEQVLRHWADEERARHQVRAVITEAELVLALCNYVAEAREIRGAAERSAA